MPKAKKPIDRSRLVPGPLTTEQYNEIVGIQPAKGLINPPKPETPGYTWRGQTRFRDPVKGELNVVGELANYYHSPRRDELLKLIFDGKVTEAQWVEATSRFLYPGKLDRRAIESAAQAKYGKKEKTSGELYYERLDRAERLATYGGATDTKSDSHIDRRNRLRRALRI